MSIDIQLLYKIITNQFKKHITKIIHHDQVDSIPKIQRHFNIYSSIKTIQYISIYMKYMITLLGAKRPLIYLVSIGESKA